MTERSKSLTRPLWYFSFLVNIEYYVVLKHLVHNNILKQSLFAGTKTLRAHDTGEVGSC